MECKITFINGRPSRSSVAAMTLVEMIVAVGVGSLLLAVLASFVLFNARSFAAMANYADLEYASRNALDQISTSVRQTSGFRDYSDTKISLIDTNGQNLVFEYVPEDETLYMVRGGNMAPLLTHCSSLKFDCRQRNPQPQEWDQVAPLSPDLTTFKVLKVGWVCTRRLFGSSLFNTEVMQTTRIVIRSN